MLHVDIDAFFVAVERLRSPGLRGRPVVVGGTGPRSVVAAASYEVRSYGIRSAMPMSRARALCRDLIVVPPDHAEYARVSEEVFAVFRSFTPLVEGLSIDEAFLDIGGLRHHFPGPAEVGHAVRAAIAEKVGITASVGVAATKFLAKLASETAKPDGLCHVPAHEQQDFLDPLRIEALWGVGQATRAALETVGVETVADLRAVPTRALERAVGASVATHLVELAHGRDPRKVEPDREVKSVSVEETYDTDITGEAALRVELRRLADRLGTRLRRSGLAGRTITLKVRTSDFQTVTRSVTRPDATNGDRDLFLTAVQLLDASDRGAKPIRLLGIGVSHLVSTEEAVQLVTTGDPRWNDLDAAVDAIRRRFGDDAVGPAGLADLDEK
ncbi:MAG TPA: DNA polymerase IV [Acidimicrobiia bacterium]|nr:DNA polymerase IV [Acidimicrobiia bacterium]